MAITRPTTKTIISTTQWGIPVTDAVNQNQTDIATINGKITPTVWTAVTFQNGWTNYSGYVTQYRKVGDIVYTRGGVMSGTLGQSIFTLPAGFRPPAPLQFLNPSWATALATVQVNIDGTVIVNSSGNADNRFCGLVTVFSITA